MNFPWKQQKIVIRGPVADYSRLRESLPKPPKGKVWHQDKGTKEWALVAEDGTEPELLVDGIVENLPIEGSDGNNYEEWEVLSEKPLSQHSSPLVVAKAGSVRSLSSMEHSDAKPGQAALPVPFKIQRTASSSTIDSNDNALGPSGKGVLGIDYVEHVVLASDTLQGICLAYKVNATRLRQANCFSGNSLSLAPKKLVIPLSKQALRSGCIRVQDTDAKEFKLHAFLAEFPDLSITEAKAYLELADWILADAVESAKEDSAWEKELDTGSLKGGEIRITTTKGFLNTQGAGFGRSAPVVVAEEEEDIDQAAAPKLTPLVTSREAIPAIASKTVKAIDIYNAQQGQGEFGVEMKSLTRPLLREDGLVPPR